MLTQRAQEYVFVLFTEFVDLRQNGYNRDEAWQIVVSSDASLKDVEKQALLVHAKEWERKNGNQYVYRQQSAEATMVKRPIQMANPIQPLPGPPPPIYNQPSKALTGTLDPSALRQLEQKRMEQILEQTDPHAGFVIEEPSLPAGSTQPLLVQADPTDSPTYFGERTRLLMYFKGAAEPLQIHLEGEKEMLIGRLTENSAMAPDIDLAPYGAIDYGVSRMHAAIKREKNQLLITDLGSANQTFLNGKRVFPDEVRVLQHGDDVWFARLLCRLRFYHPR